VGCVLASLQPDRGVGLHVELVAPLGDACSIADAEAVRASFVRGQEDMIGDHLVALAVLKPAQGTTKLVVVEVQVGKGEQSHPEAVIGNEPRRRARLLGDG